MKPCILFQLIILFVIYHESYSKSLKKSSSSSSSGSASDKSSGFTSFNDIGLKDSFFGAKSSSSEAKNSNLSDVSDESNDPSPHKEDETNPEEIGKRLKLEKYFDY